MATLVSLVFPVNDVIFSRIQFAMGRMLVVAHLSLIARSFAESGLTWQIANVLPSTGRRFANLSPIALERGLHRIGHVKSRCRCQ